MIVSNNLIVSNSFDNFFIRRLVDNFIYKWVSFLRENFYTFSFSFAFWCAKDGCETSLLKTVVGVDFAQLSGGPQYLDGEPELSLNLSDGTPVCKY